MERDSEGPAYLIGHISIRDPAAWEAYKAQVPATMAPFGAELLFRGRRRQVFSGSHPHEQTVVARFPSAAALEAWHASPAYQALIPLRERAAEVTLLSFDAC